MKIPLYYSQSVLKQRVMVSASKGSSFIFIVIFVRFTRLGQAYNSIIKLGFSGFSLPRNPTVRFALLQDNLIYKFVACKSAIQHRWTNRFKRSSCEHLSADHWPVTHSHPGHCVIVRVSPVSGRGWGETNEICSNEPVKILQINEWLYCCQVL